MAEPPPIASPSSPSPTSIAFATAILSLALGYFIGSASSIGIFSSSSQTTRSKAPIKSWPNSYDVTIHPDSSDEELMKSLGRGKKEVKDSHSEGSSDEDEDEVGRQGELEAFKGNKEECKLVLVVRTDLGMGKGESCFPLFAFYPPSQPSILPNQARRRLVVHDD